MFCVRRCLNWETKTDARIPPRRPSVSHGKRSRTRVKIRWCASSVKDKRIFFSFMTISLYPIFSWEILRRTHRGLSLLGKPEQLFLFNKILEGNENRNAREKRYDSRKLFYI